MGFFDRIVVFFVGKRIAYLGVREAGKTQLRTFLETRRLSSTYRATVVPEVGRIVRTRVYQPADVLSADEPVKITLKKATDVPGAGFREEWRAQALASHYLLYLFRVDWLSQGDSGHAQDVESDAQAISDWLREAGHTPCAVLVGTHCDLDPEYPGLDYEDDLSIYKAAVLQHPSIQKARSFLTAALKASGAAHRAHIVLGSLEAQPAAESLVYNLFRELRRQEEER